MEVFKTKTSRVAISKKSVKNRIEYRAPKNATATSVSFKNFFIICVY